MGKCTSFGLLHRKIEDEIKRFQKNGMILFLISSLGDFKNQEQYG